MKFGITLNVGDPRTQAQLAARAEAAGWDGVFSWDAIAIGPMETYDPWVMLAAMAMTTERVTLGAMVFVPTRRRPWKMAREAMTLDHLSNGRLVLPVGLGVLDDLGFGNVGEPTEIKTRAAILDETLPILDRLWTGKPVAWQGEHFRFGEMTFLPTPVQRPRIPIWVIGVWPSPKSIGRALRWDGLVVQTDDPAELTEICGHVREARARSSKDRPFEIVAQGQTPPDPAAAGAIVKPFADAGATWWIDGNWSDVTAESLRERVDAGPPRTG
jgi:alkanesulfonate monooxygenase SsuD/methylene tetrahydromethanopterin reductase-like flavin-dependent oxidoreductase (luciferase family)